MLKLYLMGGAAAAVVALALFAAHEHKRADREHDAAVAATRQAKLNAATTQAVDHVATQTIVIRDKAEKAATHVQQAPGADAPLPPAVLDSWRDGLRALAAGPDDQPASEPPY